MIRTKFKDVAKNGTRLALGFVTFDDSDDSDTVKHWTFESREGDSGAEFMAGITAAILDAEREMEEESKDWRARAVSEAKELGEKIKKLDVFSKKGCASGVTEAQWALIGIQLDAMRAYFKVLHLRLNIAD